MEYRASGWMERNHSPYKTTADFPLRRLDTFWRLLQVFWAVSGSYSKVPPLGGSTWLVTFSILYTFFALCLLFGSKSSKMWQRLLQRDYEKQKSKIKQKNCNSLNVNWGRNSWIFSMGLLPIHAADLNANEQQRERSGKDSATHGAW